VVVNELESSRKGAVLIDENLVAWLKTPRLLQSGSQISLSICRYRCLCVVYRCLCVVYRCLCVVYRCLCVVIVVYVLLSLSMCFYRCLCVVYRYLCVVYRCLCVVYRCLCVVYVFLDAATLTEVFPCFFSVVRQMPGYN
jgi:hypothetical protein